MVQRKWAYRELFSTEEAAGGSSRIFLHECLQSLPCWRVLHGGQARLTHLMMPTISSIPLTNVFWRIRLCAASLCLVHGVSMDSTVHIDSICCCRLAHRLIKADKRFASLCSARIRRGSVGTEAPRGCPGLR